jgi:hypothetical protein
VALAGLLGGAVLLTGCGESRHANEQRPQVSRRVSVTITGSQVIVQPGEIGGGPERNAQIPQNQNHPQPPIKTRKPLSVTFVVANESGQASTVRILDGSRLVKGVEVPPRSPESIQADLPAGAYTISAAGTAGVQPGHLTVGSYRASSQNDVLLP